MDLQNTFISNFISTASLIKILVIKPTKQPAVTLTIKKTLKEPNAGGLYSIHCKIEKRTKNGKPQPKPPYKNTSLIFYTHFIKLIAKPATNKTIPIFPKTLANTPIAVT